MNDTITVTLRELIATHGTDLCTDWTRLEGLLRDYAGQHRREINVLVTAAREGVAEQILRLSGSQVDPVLFDRLTSRLHEGAGIDKAFAEWAVASWAEALGKQVQSVPAPRPSRPSVPSTMRVAAAIVPQNADRVVQLARWGKGSVGKITYSPDGRLLAVASSLGIYLYDAGTLEEVRFIETDARVWSVAFSPDRALLASGSGDNTVRLWRAADGRLLRTLEGHTSEVRSVAFSPAGALLASGSNDGTVRLWEVPR